MELVFKRQEQPSFGLRALQMSQHVGVIRGVAEK